MNNIDHIEPSEKQNEVSDDIKSLPDKAQSPFRDVFPGTTTLTRNAVSTLDLENFTTGMLIN